MLTYARHLAVGRVAPTRVLAEVDYGNHTPDPADILRKVAEGGDAGTALESYNPPHDGFRALKAKLAELRAHAAQAGNVVPTNRPSGRAPGIRARQRRLLPSARSPATISIACWPTWNAGAGCHAISAKPT